MYTIYSVSPLQMKLLNFLVLHTSKSRSMVQLISFGEGTCNVTICSCRTMIKHAFFQKSHDHANHLSDDYVVNAKLTTDPVAEEPPFG